jgi:hypothetical protein
MPPARIGCGIIIALQHNNNISKVNLRVRWRSVPCRNPSSVNSLRTGISEGHFVFSFDHVSPGWSIDQCTDAACGCQPNWLYGVSFSLRRKSWSGRPQTAHPYGRAKCPSALNAPRHVPPAEAANTRTLSMTRWRVELAAGKSHSVSSQVVFEMPFRDAFGYRCRAQSCVLQVRSVSRNDAFMCASAGTAGIACTSRFPASASVPQSTCRALTVSAIRRFPDRAIRWQPC